MHLLYRPTTSGSRRMTSTPQTQARWLKSVIPVKKAVRYSVQMRLSNTCTRVTGIQIGHQFIRIRRTFLAKHNPDPRRAC
jgi:hypothetical protein